MGLGGADSMKSQKYNLMVAGSCPAANILAIFVLMYRFFCNQHKFFGKTTRKVDENNEQPY